MILECSLPDVEAISRAGVNQVLALPLQFTLPDWPALLPESFVYTLAAKIQDFSLMLLATDLLVDPPFGFWHTILMYPTIPQLKLDILAARQSLWFLNLLGCEYLPHPLQSLAYCRVSEVLTSKRKSSGGCRFNPNCRQVTIQEYLTLVPSYG